MNNIIFICPHGGAKSVIAASLFNAAGLPIEGVAVAGEDPYEAVPPPVAALLAAEGFDVASFKPRRAHLREPEEAARVISIGCPVTGSNVEHWDDVPQASEDLEGSFAAIKRHVDALIAELRG